MQCWPVARSGAIPRRESGRSGRARTRRTKDEPAHRRVRKEAMMATTAPETRTTTSPGWLDPFLETWQPGTGDLREIREPATGRSLITVAQATADDVARAAAAAALAQPAWALALGNAVVLKPDPQTPVCGGAMFEAVFREAGLPDGLLHVLVGGADVGEAIVTDPNVNVVSFTGSTAAGRRVGELAGRLLKKVSLELGGNNALVVLDGADLDAAASAGAYAPFQFRGRLCFAAGRHTVPPAIARDYVDALA